MAKRTYSAMLEPAETGGFGVSFPDLPGCVSFGPDLAEAHAAAEEALSLHLEGMAEDGEAFPEPGHYGDQIMERAQQPGGQNIVWALIAAEAPDESDRVNVYLPKSLLERVDRFGAHYGLNRSAVFSQAARLLIDGTNEANAAEATRTGRLFNRLVGNKF